MRCKKTGRKEARCKGCKSELAAKNYASNKARIRAQNLRWRAMNMDKVRAQALRWQRRNRDKVKQYNARFRKLYPEKVAEIARVARAREPEKFRKRLESYRERNRDRLLKEGRDYHKKHRARYQARRNERRKTDPVFRISCLLRVQLYSAIRRFKGRKVHSVLALVGTTVPNLIEHLKSTMPNGAEWADVMAGRVHIDHIRPCASFDLSKHEEQRACFHFTNLQLLWASDNQRKWRHWKPAATMLGICRDGQEDGEAEATEQPVV